MEMKGKFIENNQYKISEDTVVQTNQGKKGIEDAIELLSKVPKGLPPLKYSKAMEEATK